MASPVDDEVWRAAYAGADAPPLLSNDYIFDLE